EERKPVAQNDAQEGTLTKLQREADLLRGGISAGVAHRLSEPTELLRDSAIAFAGGYALKTALNAGGPWGTAAKVVGGVFGLGAAADVARRTAPTVAAMADTWKSGKNMEFNKVVVANNLGTALVDYSTMGLAGYAGFKSAGSPKLIELKIAEINMRHKIEPVKLNYDLDIKTQKTIAELAKESGQKPVMRQTVNVAAEQMRGAVKGAGWNEAELLKVDTRRLLASLSMEKPTLNTKPGVSPLEKTMQNLDRTMNEAAMKAVNSLDWTAPKELPKFGKEWTNPGNLKLPNDLGIKAFDPKQFANTFDIKASRVYPMFPVVPVDLKSELSLLQGPKVEGLGAFFKADQAANAARAAADGAVIGAAAAAGQAAVRIEQAPPPREVLQLQKIDIQKLMQQIPQKPQAFIEMHHLEELKKK
ncbi:MAG: hypothetical protein K2X27_16615, partial [Candidatus Obscuribacterales bacterium]|nr:hypothetical protein [Candidatus Obscuribacterales bacterium]